MTVQIVVPELGESVIEATVARWLKQAGERVSAGEPVVVLETDKVDLEVAAAEDGVLAQIQKQTGEDVKVGDVLGTIDESASAQPTPGSGEAQPAAQAPAEAQKADGAAKTEPQREPDGVPGVSIREVTPVARRLAEEQQVDLTKVTPQSGGRVTKDDVQRYLETQRQSAPTPAPAPAAPKAAASAPMAVVSAAAGRREEREKMSRRRRTIAARLVEAQRTAAMLTTFNEIDMSAVMDVRQRRKEAFQKKHGIGLGLSSFFVKAVVGALKAFPRLNAEIDGDEIVAKYYYDIGVAIGAAEGLVVPVLRDADRMSFADIERAIKRFAQQAEDGALSLEDLRGGTFTITNGGIFGSLLSTPILNPPQVGILGMHKIEQRPIALNGEVVIRPMMYVALSYDHRIVDGREAVQFLVRVKELAEDPETLLIEG